MREVADRERIERLMRALGEVSDTRARVYLVGGTTAVLMGWRQTTIDVDLVARPEDDAMFRAMPELKERLHVNIEMASPLDFIPIPPGWEERGIFIKRVGRVDFFHFDLYGQAMSKLERGHRQDLDDVRAMLQLGLISAQRGMEYFAQIEPELYRFPAIDGPTFRRTVEGAFLGR